MTVNTRINSFDEALKVFYTDSLEDKGLISAANEAFSKIKLNYNRSDDLAKRCYLISVVEDVFVLSPNFQSIRISLIGDPFFKDPRNFEKIAELVPNENSRRFIALKLVTHPDFTKFFPLLKVSASSIFEFGLRNAPYIFMKWSPFNAMKNSEVEEAMKGMLPQLPQDADEEKELFLEYVLTMLRCSYAPNVALEYLRIAPTTPAIKKHLLEIAEILIAYPKNNFTQEQLNLSFASIEEIKDVLLKVVARGRLIDFEKWGITLEGSQEQVKDALRLCFSKPHPRLCLEFEPHKFGIHPSDQPFLRELSFIHSTTKRESNHPFIKGLQISNLHDIAINDAKNCEKFNLDVYNFDLAKAEDRSAILEILHVRLNDQLEFDNFIDRLKQQQDIDPEFKKELLYIFCVDIGKKWSIKILDAIQVEDSLINCIAVQLARRDVVSLQMLPFKITDLDTRREILRNVVATIENIRKVLTKFDLKVEDVENTKIIKDKLLEASSSLEFNFHEMSMQFPFIVTDENLMKSCLDHQLKAVKALPNVTDFNSYVKKIEENQNQHLQIEWIEWLKEFISEHNPHCLTQESVRTFTSIMDIRGRKLRGALTTAYMMIVNNEKKFEKWIKEVRNAPKQKGNKIGDYLLPMLVLVFDYDKEPSKLVKNWGAFKDGQKKNALLRVLLELSNAKSVLFDPNPLTNERKKSIITNFLSDKLDPAGADMMRTLLKTRHFEVFDKGLQGNDMRTFFLNTFRGICASEFNIQNISEQDFNKLLESRRPDAFFIYRSLQTDERVIENFSALLHSIIDGSYEFNRYQTTHLEEIFRVRPDLRVSWPEKIVMPIEEMGGKFITEFTADWDDMTLLGEEVTGSCQALGNKEMNHCLLGYLMDGKNKVILIREVTPTGVPNAEKSKILGRCIVRLMIKDGRPALYLERYYTSSHNEDMKVYVEQMAKFLAQKFNVPVYQADWDMTKPVQTIPLQSLGTNAPFEYVDADGIKATSGPYEIKRYTPIA